MNSTYVKYELLRTLRNKQSYIFSLAFPVILFLVIGGANKSSGDANFSGTGIDAITYYMVGMLSFGVIGAVVSGGARISVDRSTGWNRQLRLSPLRPGVYLGTKLAIGYLTALLTIAVMYIAGISMGAHTTLTRWVEMTLLILVALVPFAAIGVFIGHIAHQDAMGPIMGGLMSLFALLGGSYFPLGTGVLAHIGSYIPSYWIVQAAHLAVGGHAWSAKGWLVIAGWSIAFLVLAMRAYQADTQRAS
ncbi:MAG: ABC transporter permease [Jatrophihabitans sp.]